MVLFFGQSFFSLFNSYLELCDIRGDGVGADEEHWPAAAAESEAAAVAVENVLIRLDVFFVNFVIRLFVYNATVIFNFINPFF